MIFLIQMHLLLVFYMDGREFCGQCGLCSCVLVLWIVFFIELNHYIKVFFSGNRGRLACLVSSSLDTFPGPVLNVYEMTPSGVCILLLSFALRAILLSFSVNELCTSLLKLCSVLRIVPLFSRHVL